MKCVMIIDNELPAGVAANTAAALGVSLASHVKGLTGNDTTDSRGTTHRGIINTPLPILSLDKNGIKQIYDSLLGCDDEMTLIGFSDVAQKIHCYNELESEMLR